MRRHTQFDLTRLYLTFAPLNFETKLDLRVTEFDLHKTHYDLDAILTQFLT